MVKIIVLTQKFKQGLVKLINSARFGLVVHQAQMHKVKLNSTSFTMSHASKLKSELNHKLVRLNSTF